MSENSISRRSLMRGGIVVGAAGTVAAATGVGISMAETPGTTAKAPAIIDAAAWNARKPSSQSEKLNSQPHYIVVHHMASTNDVAEDEAAAKDIAYRVQGWHMDGNGWNDSGQQFSVSRGGHIMEGRQGSLDAIKDGGYFMRGIHAGKPANSESIGIENEGTFSEVEPPETLIGGLTELVCYIATQYNIPASQVYGHRDFMNTDCPGTQLYMRIQELRTAINVAHGNEEGPVWAGSRVGTRGERVKSVQYLLNQHKVTTEVDGSFGDLTDGNVKKFQGNKGLVQDGIVGPKTWAKLNVELKQGDKNDAVKGVQSQLSTNHGIPTTVDGDFGPTTKKNVAAFQEARGLKATGAVNAATWQLLVA